ncbi:hypothetical protein TNCV_4425301 [Trichonephila clavipes]|nr:hypothetical protein TNCV_4425301 [Trichonephila clavipes]
MREWYSTAAGENKLSFLNLLLRINNGETRSRHLAVGRLRIIKKKRTSEIIPLSKTKTTPDSGSVDSPIRFRSKCKCFETRNLVSTVGSSTAQQTSHSSAFSDQASLPTTPKMGLEAL